MYDFYFGEKADIFRDEIKYLLSIKRMMPRWCNSIPDSEFIAIFNDLKDSKIVNEKNNGAIVETGCGASTIVLAYFAFKYNKKLYTWDINQNKLSYIRSIIVDTIEKQFMKSVFNVWCYVPYVSTSNELGIGIMNELNQKIDFAFFDSEHTSDVLLSEINLVLKYANDGAILALDDANYNYKYKNISYINVFRKKMGLSPVACPEDNITDKFYILAESEIKKMYPKSYNINDTYKSDFKNDIFWEYFSNDRQIMNNLNMEKLNELEHRYDSFKIVK